MSAKKRWGLFNVRRKRWSVRPQWDHKIEAERAKISRTRGKRDVFTNYYRIAVFACQEGNGLKLAKELVRR